MDALPIVCGKTGSWKDVGAMMRGRYAPGFALLDDGTTLLAGGWDAKAAAQSSAVIYDPATNALSPAGKLATARNFPAVAQLSKGFLFVGGFNDGLGSVRTADVFDSSTGKFSATGMMHEARELFSATALEDGRVLVVGGLSAAGLKVRTTAEIYDPATSKFELTTQKPVEPRFGHGAVWVPMWKRVFLVGGKTIGPNGDVGRTSAEWFDPATGAFALAGNMMTARDRPVVALLDETTILIAGGANPTDGSVASTELFDISKGTFSPGPPMNKRRMAHAAARLGDGKILIVGGWSDSESPAASTAQAEIFDPTDRSFTLLPPLGDARHDAAAIAVLGCSVLVVGGIQVNGMMTTTPLSMERIDL
jgi:hypothetical protein